MSEGGHAAADCCAAGLGGAHHLPLLSSSSRLGHIARWMGVMAHPWESGRGMPFHARASPRPRTSTPQVCAWLLDKSFLHALPYCMQASAAYAAEPPCQATTSLARHAHRLAELSQGVCPCLVLQKSRAERP